MINHLSKIEGIQQYYKYTFEKIILNFLIETTTTVYIRNAQGNIMATYEWKNADSLRLNELDIYGSSRIGMLKEDSLVACAGCGAISSTGSATLYTGSKLYELTNHLGNVLATITDKKVYVDANADDTADYSVPEIASKQDYYPFGMLMPGRRLSLSNYRFGFNTQEKVDEISGFENHNTALYWEYDLRLGKRWNVDPILNSSESSYSCFYNNPIYNTDYYGDAPTERLPLIERLKNWIQGNSFKNKANAFASENKIDEEHLKINKEGNSVQVSVFNTQKIGTNNNGESIYELEETEISFNRSGSIVGVTYNSKNSIPELDIFSPPTQEYGTPPDVGLSPIVSYKSLKDLTKFARLGNSSLKMTLPSWRKIGIDTEHIMSGHTVGGSRVSELKSLFPEGFDATQVEKTVRSAYRNVHTKLSTQGERILLQGKADNGIVVEMWLNKTTKVIETAYPK